VTRPRVSTPALWLLLGTIGCAGELRVPDVRQSTPYTCSAAALQAVLAYYGIEAREDTLSRALGATPEDGAPPDAIVRVARAHGLEAALHEGMSLSELSRAVRSGQPVVVALQAWPDQPRARFADDWDDGHYVVVIAIERDRVIVEDPSLLGSRGVLGREAFLDRWHDQDRRKRWVHLGVTFSGRRPAPPPARQAIE
jgi:predicted double-glycine peptidase